MALSRDQFLAINDQDLFEFKSPKLPDSVFIRVMSGEDRERFERIVTEKNSKNVRASFLAMVICDSQGNLLFTAKDVDALNKKSAKLLSEIYEAAVKHNYLSGDGIKELGNDSGPTNS